MIAPPFAAILCATDLGSDDDTALRQADGLSRLHGARLIVFHAMPDLARSAPLFPHLAVADNSRFVALERRVLEALDARVAMVTGRAPGQYQLALGFGTAHAAILQHATRLQADLIVVGGHGPAPVVRALLGAVAERVVRYAHCPVWVARQGPAAGPVVAASDLSDPALPAIERGLDHAQRIGARATVTHALSLPDLLMPTGAPEMPAYPTWTPADLERIRARARERLAEALVKFGAEADVVVQDEVPAKGILALAAELKASLVCVGTTGRSGLPRILLGSVAEEVVRKAACSVLVVRLFAARGA